MAVSATKKRHTVLLVRIMSLNFSEGVIARLSCPDSDDLPEIRNKDFTVSDFSRYRSFADGIDDLLNQIVGNGNLEFGFW